MRSDGAHLLRRKSRDKNLTSSKILLSPPGTYSPEQIKKAEALDRERHRPPGSSNVDPLVEERRRQLIDEGAAKASDTIENTKRTAETGILNRRKADIDKLVKAANEDPSRKPTDPVFSTEADLMKIPALAAQVQAINQIYAPQEQQVLDGYARSIRNRHGSAENWRVDPKTFGFSKVEDAAPPSVAASPAAKGAANNRTLTAKGNGPQPSPNDIVSVDLGGIPFHGTRAQYEALVAEIARRNAQRK
jgi:hypothetical protein